MKPKTHKCLALQCKQQVNMKMLMCTHHWGMVPGEIQELVYKTHMSPGKAGHFEAMQKAMQAVREKEKAAR